MLKKILPDYMCCAIENYLDMDMLYEIRVRANKPTTINYGGSYYYLGEDGLVKSQEQAFYADVGLVEDIIMKASNNSIYAYNNEIKQGYLTLSSGIRIGLSGEIVFEDNKVKTMKNFSSINIRIAHQVKNCSLKIFEKLFIEDMFANTLIISAPGAGKTTILRDIAYQLGHRDYPYNLLILDERGEISSMCDGVANLDVGKFTDVISYCSKQYGFEMGIRSLAPNIVFTDEVATESDAKAILYAASCGISVVATTHSYSVKDLFLKTSFNDLLSKKVFKRFVVLSNRNGPGTLEGVFDENYNYIT